MRNQWITDLNHLLEADQLAVSSRGLRMRLYLTEIVKAATALSARRERETALRCRRFRQRARCPGFLRVRLQDIPAEIHWGCPQCAEGGVISNWPQSPWDVSPERGRTSLGRSSSESSILIDEELYRELRKIDFMEMESERLVFSACPRGRMVLLRGEVDVFEALLADLAMEANHESGRVRQRKLSQIYEQLDRTLDDSIAPALRQDPPLEHGPPGQSASILSMPSLAILGNWFDSGRRVKRHWHFSEALEKHIYAPQCEVGGLTPRQIKTLLNAPWATNGSCGPIRFRLDLPASQVAATEAFQNAICFLRSLRDWQRVAATAAGNLSRRFVEEMIRSLPAAACWRDRYREFRKAWNEQDFQALHQHRILCEMAGLIGRSKRWFRVTRKGKRLLSGDRAGELYFSLFSTLFQRFNLGYLDHLPENYALQATISYSLLRLSLEDRAWLTPRDLASLLLLPSARAEIPQVEFMDYKLRQVETRILIPLIEFGLLEKRPMSRSRSHLGNFEVRKTPLFDRFIAFQL